MADVLKLSSLAGVSEHIQLIHVALGQGIDLPNTFAVNFHDHRLLLFHYFLTVTVLLYHIVVQTGYLLRFCHDSKMHSDRIKNVDAVRHALVFRREELVPVSFMHISINTNTVRPMRSGTKQPAPGRAGNDTPTK